MMGRMDPKPPQNPSGLGDSWDEFLGSQSAPRAAVSSDAPKRIRRSRAQIDADAKAAPVPASKAIVPRGIKDSPAPPPQEVIDLGRPPLDDAMKAAQWAFNVQMQLAYDCLSDSRLTPSQRRKEMMAIMGAAAKWMTDAMRYDTKQIIEKDRKEVEAKRRGRAAAEREDALDEVPTSARVIPIRRDG